MGWREAYRWMNLFDTHSLGEKERKLWSDTAFNLRHHCLQKILLEQDLKYIDLNVISIYGLQKYLIKFTQKTRADQRGSDVGCRSRDDRKLKINKNRRTHSISSVSIKKHKVSSTDGSVWGFIDPATKNNKKWNLISKNWRVPISYIFEFGDHMSD